MARKDKHGSVEAAAWLLVSSEPVLIDEELSDLKDRLIPPEARDLNCMTLYGWEAQLPAVLEFLQTMPFLADRRLLVIREVHKFDELKKLLAYLDDPNPLSVLVMTSTEMKPRDSSFRSLSSRAEVVELRKPRGQALSRWVQGRFTRLGKVASPEVAGTIIDVVGADMTNLAAEVVKIALYSGDRKDIQHGDLVVSMSGSVETIFSLIDAVAEGKKDQAFGNLRTLLDAASAPEFIIHMFARHYRQLVHGKVLVSQGTPPLQAAKKVGINYENLQEKFARQMRRADLDGLVRALEVLADCDRNLKTGRLPDEVVLDRLLADLLG